MSHQYTDEEIIRVILEQRRQRRRKMMRRRRIAALLVLSLLILGGCGAFRALHHTGDSPDKTKNAATSKTVKIRGTVFIDAGHGGNDPGAQALNRTEKDDTLRLALAVRSALKKRGLQAEMSRTDDTAVDRAKRGEIANRKGANLFVSLHRNKASQGQGVEIWIPSDDPKDSRLLAENIMKELKSAGVTEDRGIRTGTLPDPKDDYQENKTPDMPSCLIEFGFISDETDNRLFDEKLNTYGKALAKAIDHTYQSLYETQGGTND
ncbi:N-acetylmuramoyl-L-alanine amidase [Eubacterium pyruvativorans]|uniref:N-acetylmuramoyl-L-alanine amidase n=1 Tax=Eubacterium pyruvativorans TaxID=155865 RepID=UPI003F89F39E